jgi:7-cyano-7-deazaguanine synthase
MTRTLRAVALLSGGMDSTVMVGSLLHDGWDVDAIAVDYGQRHRRELDAAAQVAYHYGIRLDVIDLSPVGRLLTGSALTDAAVAVPHGHYADDSMRSTVVPNRNAILIMVAAGVAAARSARAVMTAVHAGDHPVYPDCRPSFIAAASECVQLATAGHGDIYVHAPFVTWTKTSIAARGHQLGAPLGLTWSCYTGGDLHCGRCGTCVERREAFRDANIPDPTFYDPAAAVGDAAAQP